MDTKLRPIDMGELVIKVPIIQGGMGVRVSTSSLAAAVADCGAAGTIASVGLAPDTEENRADVPKSCREHLRKEIRLARKMSSGVIGVNVMVALSNYEDIVRTTVEEKADYIISGAGLPLRLPEYTEGSQIKLIPLISSARGLEVVARTWKRRYNVLPDAVIVEGPLSGGHIGGHTIEDLKAGRLRKLEDNFTEVLKAVGEYEKVKKKKIPVMAAGGIFDGRDMARFLAMGASGVQMGTRFVATLECSVAQAYKDLYVNSDASSIVFIQSPVGMPAKVLRTKFIDDVLKGERKPIRCAYRCLRTCDPNEVQFCIAKALINAAEGDMDNALVFAGSRVSEIKKIVPVKELIEEVVREAEKSLGL
ncbi:MAG TPA: nitronate monooxygenase family protein [Candidatus Omnitrophota bacterium]|nr:nitronate monooxygenase family protein [Candidatus Omnitrophota bacterium]